MNHVRTADVVPDISLMRKMASISGTVQSRILELVDNSIDAKIKGKKLEVDIRVVKNSKEQWIEIRDNGSGMTEETAKSFFRLGDSQKEGQKKIGRFGLGAKVAIMGLGDTCKVISSPYGQDYAVFINFDIRTFDDWKVDYELKDTKPFQHGTIIRIENINIRMGDVDRFCEKLHESLGKTYKHFVEFVKMIPTNVSVVSLPPFFRFKKAKKEGFFYALIVALVTFVTVSFVAFVTLVTVIQL